MIEEFDSKKRLKKLHSEIEKCVRKYEPYMYSSVIETFVDELYAICGEFTNDTLLHLLGHDKLPNDVKGDYGDGKDD